MTVRELIELLQAYNGDARVAIPGRYKDGVPFYSEAVTTAARPVREFRERGPIVVVMDSIESNRWLADPENTPDGWREATPTYAGRA